MQNLDALWMIKKDMVEAGGIEPPSESVPLGLLHAYPAFGVSRLRFPTGRISEALAHEQFALFRMSIGKRAILLA